MSASLVIGDFIASIITVVFTNNSTSSETITSDDRHHRCIRNNNRRYKSVLHHDNIVTQYCDVIGPSYTKEIEQILKAGENVGFMNQ